MFDELCRTLERYRSARLLNPILKIIVPGLSSTERNDEWSSKKDSLGKIISDVHLEKLQSASTAVTIRSLGRALRSLSRNGDL